MTERTSQDRQQIELERRARASREGKAIRGEQPREEFSLWPESSRPEPSRAHGLEGDVYGR